MGIEPIPDPLTGAPTCPEGYGYDPSSKLCIAVSKPIAVTVTDGSTGNVFTLPDATAAIPNPKNAGTLATIGADIAGLWAKIIAAAFMVFIPLAGPFLAAWFSIVDGLFALIAQGITVGQGEGTPGFFQLSAALLGDLFGKEFDANQLQREFNGGGRLASVRTLGGDVVTTLIEEFAPSAIVSPVTPPSGVTQPAVSGLPGGQLSPGAGIAGAEAFMGFVAEFAVREGNAEMFASSIPHGLGEGVRDLAVDVARNVGLGRFGRIALMPLFKTLIATPLQWALNIQYLPTLLNPDDAILGGMAGALTTQQVYDELVMHGYAPQRIEALQFKVEKHLRDTDVQVLRALQLVDDATAERSMTFDRWAGQELDQRNKVMDAEPARRVAIGAAERIVSRYVEGHIDAATAKAFIGAIPLLTQGERDNLTQLINALTAQTALHIKTLSIGQVEQAFAEGFITLEEMETRFAAHGYPADDVSVLTFIALIKSQQYEVAAAAMAKRAAKLGITLTKPPTL